MRLLLVLEHGYRGAVEKQFADPLYVCQELNRQLGEVDLVLQGTAVTLALSPPAFQPTLPLSRQVALDLPDLRDKLRDLLADGVHVYVDRPDLASMAMDPSRLVPGVQCLDSTSRIWPEYEGVWFL